MVVGWASPDDPALADYLELESQVTKCRPRRRGAVPGWCSTPPSSSRSSERFHAVWGVLGIDGVDVVLNGIVHLSIIA
ncbi:hypothetical protein DMH04_54130 [Kibdelosporangium aridum]|uniref:Uncharacterized protein n=1 Tax=Kibdelosporangium aridum TaxID=2030 RepID=A0A428XYF5_KIBAR|nr:hypothetical protein DMH04_54130 [Kibdelosporangium aridum]